MDSGSGGSKSGSSGSSGSGSGSSNSPEQPKQSPKPKSMEGFMDAMATLPVFTEDANGFFTENGNDLESLTNILLCSTANNKSIKDKGKKYTEKDLKNFEIMLNSIKDTNSRENIIKAINDSGTAKVSKDSKGQYMVKNIEGTGKPVKVVSPVWQSSDADYSPAVQRMILELNFDWYFADSIKEQNKIVQRAKDIRKDAEDGIEWWVDKAGKITSAAADEFSWFLGGSPSANESNKWLEINQMFQSDMKITDDKTLATGMFIAGMLMPGGKEGNLFSKGVKSWIKHGTYNELRDTLGKEGVEKFIKAASKGIVGAEGENGIKLIGGKGIEEAGKLYKYELKVFGKGTSHYRILGNYDEKTGHIIFEKIINK